MELGRFTQVYNLSDSYSNLVYTKQHRFWCRMNFTISFASIRKRRIQKIQKKGKNIIQTSYHGRVFCLLALFLKQNLKTLFEIAC